MSARPWPGQPDCAYLLIAGGHSPDLHLPGAAVIREWLVTLRTAGYARVRSGAVGPDIAGQLTGMGFSVCQNLALLSTDLTTGHALFPRDRAFRVVRRGPGYQGKVMGLLAVDEQAFGPEWALDMDTFREASRATQSSRVWVSHTAQGDVAGFLLAGRTGRTGFVQRVAVEPSSRRSRVATGLLTAGHHWMRVHGCTTAVVNTETSNRAALELYRHFGYVDMPYGLQVLERTLQGDAHA